MCSPPSIPGFTLGSLLGEGSFSRVYAAEAASGQAVAVKLLTVTARGEEDARERWIREVEVLEQVGHPALAPLLAFDLTGEAPYFVFPRYPGGDLSQRLEEAPLSSREVAALAQRMAGALGALHAAGVVHRDVKSSNVFLDEDGLPVLGDLGLVRGEEHDPLTTQGVAVGTLGYMAPEVRAGDPASPASDLFSLGVVLFEAAGGARPVVTNRQVVFAAGGRPPGLCPRGDALIRRMLDPDPSRRPGAVEVLTTFAAVEGAPADAATVSLALDEAARRAEASRRGATGGPSPSEVGRARSTRALALGATLALAGVAVLAWWPAPAAPPPPTPPPSPTVPTDVGALLRGLEDHLDEEERRLEAGEAGRPGQAHVLSWLAAGHDPEALPEVVRVRLRHHDEVLRRHGAAAVFTPLLEAEPTAPGSPRARALQARAEALTGYAR